MAMPYRQHETYQNMQIQTASREELLLTTFDWLLASVRRAARSTSAGRVGTARKCLLTAQSGVLYLMGTLDMQAGGEFAARLRQLYVYVLRRLGEAAVSLDLEAIDEVQRILTSLAETWHEAAGR